MISPLAGKRAPESILANIPRLVTGYYAFEPDASVPAQQVAFGTSGHRGTSLARAFNEEHILAITQAICLYRTAHQIDGPIFLGMDTHALSGPALHEQRAAGRVEPHGRGDREREAQAIGPRARRSACARTPTRRRSPTRSA